MQDQRFIISVPRSGHHMTQWIIRKVFKMHGYPYSYCEFYGCCQTVPCPKIRLVQKNHDENFKLEIAPETKALVLYRKDLVDQLEAMYRHKCRNAEEGKIEFPYLNDHKGYIKMRLPYYERFIKKWVRPTRENIFVIDYDSMVAKPEENIADALGHLFPGMDFQGDIISKVVAEKDVRYYNRMCDEQYNRFLEGIREATPWYRSGRLRGYSRR